MSNYEPDSLDEVPTITLERALAQIKDGTVPPGYNRSLILLLENDDDVYNVRSFTCGLTYSEVVSLLEFFKHTLLEEMLKGD